MFVKTATYAPLKFLRKNSFFFQNWTRLQTSSDFEMKKRAFSQKVFLMLFTKKNRASREMFWGKLISLSKIFFSVILFGVRVISLSFYKILESSVSNHRSAFGENKNGEITLEKLCFLKSILCFEQKKTWTLSKTVSHISQNRSLRVQMNFFRFLSGSKNICMKVFGLQTETSDFRRKCFSQGFQRRSSSVQCNILRKWW